MKPSAGILIDGKYTLLECMGSGSMGEVWHAQEGSGPGPKRSVAIKFMLGARDDLRARFMAEIAALTTLRSTYLVQVLSWGEVDGAPYMVMERLEGEDLGHVVARGPLDIKLAASYVTQAAAGLLVAHKRGIVHRDLKPANLFLDKHTGVIKVLDFGIAGAGTAIRRPLTAAGAYMGTPQYSAPEQFVDPSVTASADIWALGAILYELLAGRAAFAGTAGDYPSLIAEITTREPSNLAQLRSGLPTGLVACVMRCLRKSPQARYPDATALIRDLAPFGDLLAQSIRAAHEEGSTLVIPAQAPPPKAGDAHAADAPADAAGSNDSGSGGDDAADSSVPPTATTQPPHSAPRFYDDQDLLDILLDAVKEQAAARPIAFMLGAGFSAPVDGKDGVPLTAGVISRLRARLTTEQNNELGASLRVSRNKYQEAFDFIRRKKSLAEANTVVRTAVLDAYRGVYQLPSDPNAQATACEEFENRLDAWAMPPGVEHLGKIVAEGLKVSSAAPGAPASNGPKGLSRFARIHLTTNFDPLLSIAIRKNGGQVEPPAVDDDYEIPALQMYRCLVVHLHGRWREGATLHNELSRPRPKLRASLDKLLRTSTLVVLGYGGWDDVFMRTLEHAVTAMKDADILWGFFDKKETVIENQAPLLAKLAALNNQVRLFQDVNTNTLFQRLEAKLFPALGKPEIEPGPPSGNEERIKQKPWGRLAAGFIAGLCLVGGLAWRASKDDPIYVGKPPNGAETGAAFTQKPTEPPIPKPPTMRQLRIERKGKACNGAITLEGEGGWRVTINDQDCSFQIEVPLSLSLPSIKVISPKDKLALELNDDIGLLTASVVPVTPTPVPTPIPTPPPTLPPPPPDRRCLDACGAGYTRALKAAQKAGGDRPRQETQAKKDLDRCNSGCGG